MNTVYSYKSRNTNIIKEYNNFLSQNNNKGKISRTFHNINNSKYKNEISYYQSKDKPDLLSKIKSEDNKIKNNNKKKEILILGKTFQNTSYPKGRNIIESKNLSNSLKNLSFSFKENIFSFK